MAMRFMKVKRVVIPFLTVVIMLSQLSGCAVATPEDIVDLPSEVTLVIEEAEMRSSNMTQIINSMTQIASMKKVRLAKRKC